MARNEVREEYLEWKALPRRTKIVHRMPLTAKDFAREKGVTDRTLRRWQDDPDFQQKLLERQQELAAQAPNAIVAGVGGSRPSKDSRTRASVPPPVTPDGHLPDDVPEDERNYLSAKSALTALCQDGDLKAIDLYLKHYGKPFIEAEQSSRESDLAGLTDDDLIDATLDTIGAERVAAWLSSR